MFGIGVPGGRLVSNSVPVEANVVVFMSSWMTLVDACIDVVCCVVVFSVDVFVDPSEI